MAEDMILYGSLASDYAHVSLQIKTDLSHFDHYFKRIKKRIKELEGLETGMYTVNPTDLLDGIIGLVKYSGIPFERLAPYLVEKLGKNLAKNFVKKETMLKDFGKEGLEIWEALLK